MATKRRAQADAKKAEAPKSKNEIASIKSEALKIAQAKAETAKAEAAKAEAEAKKALAEAEKAKADLQGAALRERSNSNAKKVLVRIENDTYLHFQPQSAHIENSPMVYVASHGMEEAHVFDRDEALKVATGLGYNPLKITLVAAK